mmetsp:Transcript_14143/g.22011  ORF Transcript_14143/g.22011 Transcript_14143/m.22011 type:complete len:116 (+) Transcript_14143:676-1023(+)
MSFFCPLNYNTTTPHKESSRHTGKSDLSRKVAEKKKEQERGKEKVKEDKTKLDYGEARQKMFSKEMKEINEKEREISDMQDRERLREEDDRGERGEERRGRKREEKKTGEEEAVG